jgi:alkylation response protein AidB-like acyl-CoA dehydrogenase
MSLILVEADRPGFRRGKNLEKLGHLSSDTSELFFDDVRVPAANLLGAEGGAMGALMSELPQERLTIALHSIAAAQKVHGRVVDQCLQFFGGYGFMRGYEICRLYADARVLRIYGGTSEIMRELISRNL